LTGIVTQEILKLELNSGDHSLTDLQSIMAASMPDAEKVVVRGRKLQEFLNSAAGQFPRIDKGNRREVQLSLEQITALRTAVTNAGPDIVKENWDGATQVYLALTALQRAHRDLRNLKITDLEDPVLKALMELRTSLEFPAELDSPGDYAPAPIKTIDEALNTIRTSLD
jgi:hypothetical protein